jgi:hypothetical protein
MAWFFVVKTESYFKTTLWAMLSILLWHHSKMSYTLKNVWNRCCESFNEFQASFFCQNECCLIVSQWGFSYFTNFLTSHMHWSEFWVAAADIEELLFQNEKFNLSNGIEVISQLDPSTWPHFNGILKTTFYTFLLYFNSLAASNSLAANNSLAASNMQLSS